MSDKDVRAAWARWAAQMFGGDARKVSVATEAALRALKEGARPTEATRRAQEAVMAASPHHEGPRAKFDLVAARQQWSMWTLRDIIGDEEDRANAREAVVQALAAGRSIEEAMVVGRSVVKPPPAGMLRGRVTGLRQRYDMVGRTSVPVLSFRVQRFDLNGRLLPPILVEIQGGEFEGSINDGDVVQFQDQRRSEKQTVRLKALSNLSTGVPFGKPGSVKELMSVSTDTQSSVETTRAGRTLWRWALLLLGLGITLQSCVKIRTHGQPHNSTEAHMALIAQIWNLIPLMFIAFGALLMLRYILRRRR